MDLAWLIGSERAALEGTGRKKGVPKEARRKKWPAQAAPSVKRHEQAKGHNAPGAGAAPASAPQTQLAAKLTITPPSSITWSTMRVIKFMVSSCWVTDRRGCAGHDQ
ncbi:MAG: hypothetical protein JNJ71_07200 [Rubrivivax sp.]|nr:hypothetical protein [Rubrivivax sp.]